MAIPESFIQELLARADVVEIVGRYVPLKKTGANFAGLCPFHSEKSPSFTVSPSKQFFHCFGCGKHGNAIGFLMEHAGMGFVEAVKDLAGQFGMQVPEDERSPQERERADRQRQQQATLTEVLEKAAEAYRQHLKNAPRAVAYLKGRGLSGEVAKRFGLGYAPEGWRSLASVFAHYDDPLLAESGLVIVHEEDDKRYDRFRDRVMFPIRNVKGECIGFGGRVLGDEKPKYLNSPETPVFSKGRELYGLFEARQALREQGYVLVTEGYMDVVALAQLGFPNAVATLGTACTAEHVQKLFRFTDAVVFSFDGDAAGRRAARKALEGALPYATDLRSVKFLFLPSEHDPDSYIREHGRDAFARYVGEATPLSRFLVDSAREGCDLSSAEGRARFAANAKPLWTALPEGTLKRQLLSEIAGLCQLSGAELESVWTGRPVAGGGQRRRPWREPGSEPAARVRGRVHPLGRADRALQIVLSDPGTWERLSGEEHHLLCELPAPHGPLFTWVDARLHEAGPVPWPALRPVLAGHEHEDYAARLMERLPEAIENDPAELANIVQREREHRRAEEMKALSQRAATDPDAYERLKQLVAASRPAPKQPS
ncbi:DNA primase [Ramlibacter rhizophilus]|uniref:DNA primase n=1 Tax=Ramlibacter rhizophilus TaxID=1781167 RepID=A0A4Z0BID8_9BURK|nr:DNA primase [Ramlibacter rhizophilus]TFY98530.1 DNA primase [Ramlibacter rhizophilus]